MTREVGPERRDGPSGHANEILIQQISVVLGTLFWDFLPVLFLRTEFVCSHLSVPV